VGERRVEFLKVGGGVKKSPNSQQNEKKPQGEEMKKKKEKVPLTKMRSTEKKRGIAKGGREKKKLGEN